MVFEGHLENVSKTAERLMNSAVILAGEGKVAEAYNNAAAAASILKNVDLSANLRHEVEKIMSEKGRLFLAEIAHQLGFEVTIQDKNKSEQTS